MSVLNYKGKRFFLLFRKLAAEVLCCAQGNGHLAIYLTFLHIRSLCRSEIELKCNGRRVSYYWSADAMFFALFISSNRFFLFGLDATSGFTRTSYE